MLKKLWLSGLFLLCLAVGNVVGAEQDESWVYGKWELSYDPDGAKTDYLEFLSNGDAWSIGANGRIPGFYIVDGQNIKAVFTWKKKDIIMIFHGDPQKQELKIITSRSGRESIYKKISTP